MPVSTALRIIHRRRTAPPPTTMALYFKSLDRLAFKHTHTHTHSPSSASHYNPKPFAETQQSFISVTSRVWNQRATIVWDSVSVGGPDAYEKSFTHRPSTTVTCGSRLFRVVLFLSQFSHRRLCV